MKKNNNRDQLLNFSLNKKVPLILQSETSECGLACLLMVSSYYGYKIDIASIRKHLNISSQGMNLREMINLSDKLNLNCRAIKCEIKELKDLKLPCIIHWNLDHFVVLTKVTKSHVMINDPSKGNLKLTLDACGNSFTGIALEVWPNASFERKDLRVKLKLSSLWSHIKGLKRSLALLLSMSVILQFSILAAPYYTINI